jgi:hypothetical protein
MKMWMKPITTAIKNLAGKRVVGRIEEEEEETTAGEVEAEERVVLAPLVDMLNHNQCGVTHVREKRFDEERQALVITNFLPCPENQEVLLNYGELSSQQLLHYYGYLPPPSHQGVNDDDCLDVIPFELNPFLVDTHLRKREDSDDFSDIIMKESEDEGEEEDGELMEDRQSILEVYSLELSPHFLAENRLPPSPLLAVLRVLVSTPEELQSLKTAFSTPLSLVPPSLLLFFLPQVLTVSSFSFFFFSPPRYPKKTKQKLARF